MKIVVHSTPRDPLEQIAQGPIWLSDSEFLELRRRAVRYWFFVEDHADGSGDVTIHGPTPSAPAYTHVVDVAVRLDRDTAAVRLLSEVCCAIAATSEIFLYVESPIYVPLIDDRNLLSRTSAAWRAMHRNSYSAIAAAHAQLYPQPPAIAPAQLDQLDQQ